MFSWLPQFSQFTVFLAIAGIGFVFLLIALFFGEVFEHFDTSFDHDLGHGGPGFLSTRVLSVFVTAFGGFGAVGTVIRPRGLGASGVGFVSGLFFACLIYLFARFLYGQQATHRGPHQRPGRPARAGRRGDSGRRRRAGQVPARRGARRQDRAVATTARAIAENAAVVIEEVLGETVIVRRA